MEIDLEIRFYRFECFSPLIAIFPFNALGPLIPLNARSAYLMQTLCIVHRAFAVGDLLDQSADWRGRQLAEPRGIPHDERPIPKCLHSSA